MRRQDREEKSVWAGVPVTESRRYDRTYLGGGFGKQIGNYELDSKIRSSAVCPGQC